LNRVFRPNYSLAAAVAALALSAAIGAQPSAELVPPAALIELEAGLRALVAPRDLAKADAAAAALKSARLGLGSAEKRLAAFWQAWFDTGLGLDEGFDRQAYRSAYDELKAAEAKALASAEAFLAEPKKARAYPERSKHLLFAFDAADWDVEQDDRGFVVG